MNTKAASRIRTFFAGPAALAAGVALAAATVTTTLGAQDRPVASPQPQWELRADWIEANRAAAHAGVGLNVRAGFYTRIGAALALGAAEGTGGQWRASQRVDITARFLLDPFVERQLGFYGGAGITARHDGDASGDASSGAPVDARLLLILGLEGRSRGSVVPSVEVGLGGGLRVGIVWRRRRGGSR